MGPGRVLEESWDHSAPQGCPKGARNQKSDEKFAQPPWIPQSLGSPKSLIFNIFSIFLDFFCGRFSEARFGDLRPPILGDFGMFFPSFFAVFCEAWCIAWQCKNHCFVLVFTVFGGHRPFYKKQKKQKNAVDMRDVFRGACRHNFFIAFS